MARPATERNPRGDERIGPARCLEMILGKADGRQQLNRDSCTAIREAIDAHNFADVVPIDGTEGGRVREGDKKPHVLLVTSGVSSEITSATARIHSGKHFVELVVHWL
jgi:hypothetical protein